MIDTAILHISGQLNQYLRRYFDLSEEAVAVSNILEQDGSLAPRITNRLVLFLVNIEKETLASRGQQTSLTHETVISPPPLFLNFFLMVAAHFGNSNYPEALKFLSSAIGFFQRNPVFDHQNSPELDSRIDRLILDMENLNIRDLSSLWSILSGKYLPSVLYRVRMVAYDSADILSKASAVTSTRASAYH
ncbi:DUF4255 domain-containing protein [Pelobacter propionicus]|uniref:Pvc16 N-terminal domain-containing protein n=1 Tax=Pelobacter propionicus (strain DSM 2379 / NBRC 103807 / OttBd1) TaxID=338966 RepID=A1AKY9_PELPD|nr:DUF4255 domain-containing protein [Pelobacter propionicus]ABK98009.1 conserved hypothetical protein [Pelobacter propionicus DSM 2379]